MWASNPWMTVTRCRSIWSRQWSGSKPRVTMCLAPVTTDISMASENAKAWNSGR